MAITAILFICLFFGCMMLSIFKNPIYGLYGYLIAFYGHPPERWWGVIVPDLRYSFLAAIVTLVAIFFHPGQIKGGKVFGNPLFKALLIFTIYLWVQVLWALNTEDQIAVAVIYSKFIIVFCIFQLVIDDNKKIVTFLLCHIVGSAYLGWVAYSTYTGGRFEYIGGPSINDANAFCTHMGTALTCAGALLFSSQKKIQIIILFMIPLILNAIIMTQSRGGFLGIFVGGVAIGFLLPKKKLNLFLRFALLGFVLVSILAHDVYWDRMLTITQSVSGEKEMEGSAMSRIVIIKAQLEMFKESPLLGLGHRGTAELSQKFMDARWLTRSHSGGRLARSSHNTTMTILVEQGLIGFTIISFAMIWFIKRLYKMKKLDFLIPSDNFTTFRVAVGSSLMVILIAGQFADYMRLECTIWFIALFVKLDTLYLSKESDGFGLKSNRA